MTHRLDTLFLTMPISWKGTLAQYAGRLHRLHQAKTEVVVYDYVDHNVPALDERWLSVRFRGYRALGYEFGEDTCTFMKRTPPTGGDFEFFISGGAERDRTDDLLNAIQALSQLSYGPTRERSCSKWPGVCQCCSGRNPLIDHQSSVHCPRALETNDKGRSPDRATDGC